MTRCDKIFPPLRRCAARLWTTLVDHSRSPFALVGGRASASGAHRRGTKLCRSYPHPSLAAVQRRVRGHRHRCLSSRAPRVTRRISSLRKLASITQGVFGSSGSGRGLQCNVCAVRGDEGYLFGEDVLRDELLNGELFFSLAEAQVVMESWRRHDDAIRPHSAPEIPAASA